MTTSPTGEVVRNWMDVISIGTLLAWFGDLLPAIATALTIIWTCIRIWESQTVQTWWKGAP